MLSRLSPAIALALLATACSGGSSPGSNTPDAGGGDDVDGGQQVNACKVAPDGNAPGTCGAHAAPNSFDAEVQWSWNGPDGETNAYVMPLAANLTDDNADGAIDLCDTPDVVVVASSNNIGLAGSIGHIYLLNGSTGAQELKIATDVDASVTPAIGDLDGDGVPEIVTTDPSGHFVGFHHDGTLLFGPADAWPDLPNFAAMRFAASIALADLDGDGHVEIIAGGSVYNDRGIKKWSVADKSQIAEYSNTTAADLDGDGKLEVVFGNAAYHADGTLYWSTKLLAGNPQVANLDADPEPEILLTSAAGVSLIEHDGTVTRAEQTNFNGVGNTTPKPCDSTQCWFSAAALGDFDGDGGAEYAVSSARYGAQGGIEMVHYADQRGMNGSMVWSTNINDTSGFASGTAFDFLGDGHTETMYADEQHLYVFDGSGHAIFQMPRTSVTFSEYPIVVDVDNDGSAEIVVTSNAFGTPSPTVQVIHDRQDRWVATRRIWNQHTYHVTNVREDGTIPAHEEPSWAHLNSFRVNAQIENGGVCVAVVQ
ncbi:MAG TPA: VCBS repeat-containing protein [Kofleriaceae bacterium]|jgi:hypothetical protein